MFRLTIVTEKLAFEAHEDEKTTYQFLETFKVAKREGKHAVFSFYCQYLRQQVVVGIEQIQFISYGSLEKKED